MEVSSSESVPSEGLSPSPQELTPPQIVSRLDEYIVAQEEGKKAVAIALRNRWRRTRVAEDIREEITPKNILMIGPTGVGKTEISRRLAKLSGAPFIKVEASKFTEVGYMGRDVESIIRDLVESARSMVMEEERERVSERAETLVEDRVLDLLLPGTPKTKSADPSVIFQGSDGVGFRSSSNEGGDDKSDNSTREKLRKFLREGKLEEREVEIEITKQPGAQMQVLGPQGFAELEGQIQDMFSNMVPKKKITKRLKVKDARRILVSEISDELLDHDRITETALDRAQQSGIVFIDEIDKICAKESQKGPDVSREGVQRDLLPLVEGCTVSTKYGSVHTEHILFIASGAFHISKPSDLMPEFQGRFPIRVELSSLNAEHFERILKEPKNALLRQYTELLQTEGVSVSFTDDAVSEIAKLTAEVNEGTENIGARRLHTILEKLLEELSFSAHELSGQKIEITPQYVREKLGDLVKDRDLSKYIL